MLESVSFYTLISWHWKILFYNRYNISAAYVTHSWKWNILISQQRIIKIAMKNGIWKMWKIIVGFTRYQTIYLISNLKLYNVHLDNHASIRKKHYSMSSGYSFFALHDFIPNTIFEWWLQVSKPDINLIHAHRRRAETRTHPIDRINSLHKNPSKKRCGKLCRVIFVDKPNFSASSWTPSKRAIFSRQSITW